MGQLIQRFTVHVGYIDARALADEGAGGRKPDPARTGRDQHAQAVELKVHGPSSCSPNVIEP